MKSSPENIFPSNYGLLEYAGRFYPCHCWSTETNDFISMAGFLHWDYQEIPFARGPHHSEGRVSFAKRSQAIQYCQRQSEEFSLLWEIAKQATTQEFYPERNAWYREEIIRMACKHDRSLMYYLKNDQSLINIDHMLHEVSACIWLNLALGDDPTKKAYKPLEGHGFTVDEAIENLYQVCYERLEPALSQEVMRC